MTIKPFSPRQLPSSVIYASSVSGPSAWNFDALFVESPDGARTFFTLAQPFVDGKILTFKNGRKSIKGTEVIYHPPNIVEFTTAPATGALLESWYLIPASGELSDWVVDEVPSGVKNNSNQLFTTLYPYATGKIMPFMNGVKIPKGVSRGYIEVDSRTILINDPPEADDDLSLTYMISV